MLLKVLVVFAYLLVLGKSAERGEECVDQSGEKAICTSIQSCRISIKSLNSSAIGNKSQICMSICGYDSEPLVCCQTVSSATEKSVNLVSTTSTVFLPSNSETLVFNVTTQSSPIASSITSYNFNANNENDSERPIFTSAPLLEKFTKSTETNSIESNNLPNVLPLQSNNTTSAAKPTPTFPPFISTTTTTPVELPPVSEFIETTTSEKYLPPKTINKLLPDRNTANNLPDVLPLQSSDTISTTQPTPTFSPFIPPPTTTPVELPPVSEFIETTTFRKYLPPKTINKLLPDRNTCGFQKPRERSEKAPITTIDEFPWTVLLKYRYGYGYTSDYVAGLRCLGTLISRRYVITAAQCIISDRDLLYVESVRLGEWLISSVNDCVYNYNGGECADKVVEVGIEKKIPHPDYDPSCGLHDIALIRLDKNINYSAFIRPICLPVEDLPEPSLGTILTTSGWGVTQHGYQLDIKSKINLPVVSNDKCLNPYGNFRKMLENQFCIGTTTSNDICLTDSGGALMIISHEDKPQWYLEGVIPEGFGCDQRCHPGIYTRVTKYIGWILDTISGDSKE